MTTETTVRITSAKAFGFENFGDILSLSEQKSLCCKADVFVGAKCYTVHVYALPKNLEARIASKLVERYRVGPGQWECVISDCGDNKSLSWLKSPKAEKSPGGEIKLPDEKSPSDPDTSDVVELERVRNLPPSQKVLGAYARQRRDTALRNLGETVRAKVRADGWDPKRIADELVRVDDFPGYPLQWHEISELSILGDALSPDNIKSPSDNKSPSEEKEPDMSLEEYLSEPAPLGTVRLTVSEHYAEMLADKFGDRLSPSDETEFECYMCGNKLRADLTCDGCVLAFEGNAGQRMSWGEYVGDPDARYGVCPENLEMYGDRLSPSDEKEPSDQESPSLNKGAEQMSELSRCVACGRDLTEGDCLWCMREYVKSGANRRVTYEDFLGEKVSLSDKKLSSFGRSLDEVTALVQEQREYIHESLQLLDEQRAMLQRLLAELAEFGVKESPSDKLPLSVRKSPSDQVSLGEFFATAGKLELKDFLPNGRMYEVPVQIHVQDGWTLEDKARAKLNAARSSASHWLRRHNGR